MFLGHIPLAYFYLYQSVFVSFNFCYCFQGPSRRVCSSFSCVVDTSVSWCPSRWWLVLYTLHMVTYQPCIFKIPDELPVNCGAETLIACRASRRKRAGTNANAAFFKGIDWHLHLLSRQLSWQYFWNFLIFRSRRNATFWFEVCETE